MSKRMVVSLFLIVLLAVSVPVITAVVSTPAVPDAAEGTWLAARKFEMGTRLFDPQCPPTTSPGCGG